MKLLELITEPAKDSFQARGATACVVIPEGRATIDFEVFDAGRETAQIDDEEDEDSWLVRIGNGDQTVLDQWNLHFALVRNEMHKV